MKSDIDIILLGDRNDSIIAKNIIKCLKDEFKIIYSAFESLSEICPRQSKKTVRMYECENVRADSLSGAVVIIKKSAVFESAQVIKSTPSAVVVSAENEHHIRRLQSADTAVIACGLSPKDTVTFSSNDGGASIIALQREFKIGKTLIEPQEILIHGIGKSSYSTLAAGAAVIIIKNHFEK